MDAATIMYAACLYEWGLSSVAEQLCSTLTVFLTKKLRFHDGVSTFLLLRGAIPTGEWGLRVNVLLFDIVNSMFPSPASEDLV